MTEPPRPRHVRDKPVADLVEVIPGARAQGDPATHVSGITHDSRLVRPGDLYLARAGEHTHGITHVRQAVGAGATAVLTDHPSASAAVDAGAAVVVAVDDPRAVAGPAAAWVYDRPSAAMDVVGITGTNGKTTTAYLVEAGLRAAGRTTGLVGTVETRVAGAALPSARTTPEATDLQALFAVMRERDVDAVAMEVSSHALALDRVTGTAFSVAAFTNLSQDHLDFHRDMDDYFAAKARLFEPALAARAVVTVDDEWGRRLAATARIPVTTVGARDADWIVGAEEMRPDGGSMTLTAADGSEQRVEIALPGRFNLRNAALAFVVLVELGIAAEVAAAGVASLAAVPGRMERVDCGQPFTAIVDYAHTPDAVRVLLGEIRALLPPDARVLAVLGCGGDRDRAKRPQMGAAVAAGADVAVLTSDNPRSEDPDAILAAMAEGARAVAGATVLVEPDRRTAIESVVGAAHRGDVVVVAGKGHEQGQELATGTVPFDDRVVLREAIVAAGLAGRST